MYTPSCCPYLPDHSVSVHVYTCVKMVEVFFHVQSNADDLLVLLSHLEQHVRDKRSLQYIKKFTVTLKKISPSGTRTLSPLFLQIAGLFMLYIYRR